MLGIPAVGLRMDAPNHGQKGLEIQKFVDCEKKQERRREPPEQSLARNSLERCAPGRARAKHRTKQIGSDRDPVRQIRMCYGCLPIAYHLDRHFKPR